MTKINFNKIIIIIPSLNRGGAERVVSLLHEEFIKNYEVIIVTFYGSVAYPISGKIINLQTPTGNIVTQIKNSVVRIIKLRRIFRKYKPDLILSFLGNIQSILTFYPIVVSIRNSTFHASKLSKLLFLTIYKFSNIKQIVSVSEEITTDLKKRFHLKKCSTIYNPLNFLFIESKLTKQSPLPYKYILSAGRLENQKGFDILIKSFANSKYKRNIKLVIIGEGNEKNALLYLIKQLNIENSVELLGLKTNPYKYFQHSEAFILSSRYEGFPNVLVEALACGAAVISTNCPTGPKEIIKNNDNGVLVPVEDINALTEEIDKLLDDDNKRVILKQNAKKSVINLSIEKIAEEWVKLYSY